jgi:hypothetical protein
MLIGVLIAKTTLFIHGLGYHVTAELIGFAIHGTGLVPFIESEKTK